MKTVMAWELGGGLGHIARLKPVAEELIARGHTVHVLSRDVEKARRFLPGISVSAAPVTRATLPIARTTSFADILYNYGFGQSRLLRQSVADWRKLLTQENYDVAILDFSPTALLALQGLETKIALVGSGYYSPPDVSPLPELLPVQGKYEYRTRRTESNILTALNVQLNRQGQSNLDRVAQIFTRCDANIVTNFQELLHYPNRQYGESWGVWSELAGCLPQWPAGDGPRVLFYAKPFVNLAKILDWLERKHWPTLVYEGGRAGSVNSKYQHVQISNSPLDIWKIAEQADLAIAHAGLATTAQLLLGGLSIVQLPTNGEQKLNATNSANLGATITAEINCLDSITQALDRLAAEDSFKSSARTFAEKYAGFDRRRQVDLLVDRLEKLVSCDRRQYRRSG